MTDTAAVHAAIADLVSTHPIVLFMKGTPAFPQCGFSALAVEVLRREGGRYHAIDVLANPALRQGIKTYSNWPTIPQLYVDGELVGGCDILREMHETGELKTLLASSDRVAAARHGGAS